MQTDAEGRKYQDYYKMVLENESRTDTHTHTQKLLTTLKRELMEFARMLKWRVNGMCWCVCVCVCVYGKREGERV